MREEPPARQSAPPPYDEPSRSRATAAPGSSRAIPRLTAEHEHLPNGLLQAQQPRYEPIDAVFDRRHQKYTGRPSMTPPKPITPCIGLLMTVFSTITAADSTNRIGVSG